MSQPLDDKGGSPKQQPISERLMFLAEMRRHVQLGVVREDIVAAADRINELEAALSARAEPRGETADEYLQRCGREDMIPLANVIARKRWAENRDAVSHGGKPFSYDPQGKWEAPPYGMCPQCGINRYQPMPECALEGCPTINAAPQGNRDSRSSEQSTGYIKPEAEGVAPLREQQRNGNVTPAVAAPLPSIGEPSDLVKRLRAYHYGLADEVEKLERELATAKRHVQEHIDDKHRILREYEAKVQELQAKLSAIGKPE
jgi:hypothetical protein